MLWLGIGVCRLAFGVGRWALGVGRWASSGSGDLPVRHSLHVTSIALFRLRRRRIPLRA
jgi:hypothetical protein